MNHSCALQRHDGRWDWTTNRRAVCYCGGWHEWTEEEAKRIGFPLDYLQKKQAKEDGAFKDKYHTEGHSTQEEAERCFRQFCLDHATKGTISNQQLKCKVCDNWTQTYMGNGHHGYQFSHIMLCEEHCNQDGLNKAVPFEIGLEIWHS